MIINAVRGLPVVTQTPGGLGGAGYIAGGL